MIKHLLLIIALFFATLTPTLTYAQSVDEKQNLETAFRSRDLASREDIQFELKSANLYYQNIDGRWGNGTESALLSAFNTLDDYYGVGVSLHSMDDAHYFLDFILSGQAKPYLFGEAGECDGCGNLEQSPQSQNVASNGLPAWLNVPQLPFDATIGQWLNANNATKISTAANYYAPLITSNDRLNGMIQSGELYQVAQQLAGCIEETINFGLQTGQKNQSSRIYPEISNACVFMLQ